MSRGFLCGSHGEESATMQEARVRNIPWRTAWQPPPGFLPGTSHGQRSLAATAHGVTSSQPRLSDWHVHFKMSGMHPCRSVCSLRKTGEVLCAGALADHHAGVNGNKPVKERSHVQKCVHRENAHLGKGGYKSLVFILSVFSETRSA